MSFLDSVFSSLSTKTTPTSKRVVGVDIGSSSIKVVELQELNSVLTLTTYGEIQLGPYEDKTVGESVQLSASKEQEAFVDTLRESAVKAKQAVFAMPLHSSFITTMTLDAEPKEDISGRVRIEARKYIPIQLNQVTLDWAEIETGKSTGKHSRDVLLAAIENTALERFQTLMKFAGLQNPPSEIECFSTIRALYDTKEEHVAIIDLGASTTKLYIAKQGLLQRMHRVTGGGVQITKRLAEAEEISFEDAEILKRSVTGDTSDKYSDVQRVYRSTYERPFKEFRRVLQDYEKRSDAAIEKIYVTGGCAQFPGTTKLASESFEQEVSLGKPFSKVAYPAFMEDVMVDISGVFATALGAALRNFE